MAITKLLAIKENKGSGGIHQSLKNNIYYICNPAKTENGFLIGGNAGSTPDAIYNAMIFNKEYWRKTDQRQGYHYILSFPPEEKVTPEFCHQIAQEFAEGVLKGRYYYVTAVHTDQNHMHAHLVFDSVSNVDGLKYHSPKGDWEKRIQPVMDQICEKYQLSTLQYDPDGDRKGRNYGDWKSEKEEWKETYSAYDIIRDDIDEALQRSRDYDSFLQELKSMKYEITRDQKYLSVKPHWRKRAVRTGRLGYGYSKEELQHRIENRDLRNELQEQYRLYGDMQEVRSAVRMKVQHVRGWKMSPFQKQFYRRLFRVYHIRYPYFWDKSWKYKTDILQVKKLSRCMTEMIKNDINSLDDVTERTQQLEERLSIIQLQLRVLRTKQYRDQRFRLLSEYEKLENEEIISVDRESRKTEILNLLEHYGGLHKVQEMREEIRAEIKQYRSEVRMMKKEIQTLKDVETLSKQPQHIEELKSESKSEEKGDKWNRQIIRKEKSFIGS